MGHAKARMMTSRDLPLSVTLDSEIRAFLLKSQKQHLWRGRNADLTGTPSFRLISSTKLQPIYPPSGSFTVPRYRIPGAGHNALIGPCDRWGHLCSCRAYPPGDSRVPWKWKLSKGRDRCHSTLHRLRAQGRSAASQARWRLAAPTRGGATTRCGWGPLRHGLIGPGPQEGELQAACKAAR